MPEPDLNQSLVENVSAGKVVLFLGAGASRGAKRDDGLKIPDAPELGRSIARAFLGEDFEGADFKTICDFAASAKSVRELQEFIFKELTGFNPADFHYLLPKFVWAGIATTNYDLIVEETYKRTKNPAQDLVTNCRDGDGAAERLGDRGLLYLKLHGCITHYQEVQPPLVASTEQIIGHRQGRAGQFAQFLEWAKTKTIVFAGYGLGDFNLRTLFEEIRKDGDNHPRHYIVRPNIKSVESDYWQERRVKTLSLDFESFLRTLDLKLRPESRVLALVGSRSNSTSFSPFISKANVSESPSLRRYLETQCEHVSGQTESEAVDPKKFYRGFDLGWHSVALNLDVQRRVTQAIFDERIVAAQTVTRPQFSVLKGHAGSGKTVVLRRLAWDAARKLQKLVFRVRDGSGLSREIFEEIVSLTNQPVLVFVDNLAEETSSIADFYRYAVRQKWPLILIGAVRVHEWNVRCEELEQLADEEYDLKYLSEREIDSLLELLDKHDCLGHLSHLPIEERRKKLKETYGRQLLVALHEATENGTFRDIVADEYHRVFPQEARILYADICSLHRFGTPVRAGLISRVHGVDFEEFSRRFLRPLEQVIQLSKDGKSNDWVYRARHAVIADMVYQTALSTVQEKFDNLMRIIAKLNPSYSYDREVIYELVRGTKLAELFRDRQLGDSIYEAAIQSLGKEGLILHQRGIYEMKLAGDSGALDRAERYFLAAIEASGDNPSVKHSLAELSFKRSELARDPETREAWRRQAETQAAALARGGRNSYPRHTLAKIAIARVKDSLDRAEAQDDVLTQEALSLAIKEAEDAIRSGLQSFPNDDRLLNEDATLSEILQNADRALAALRRAFKTNPRSELIARRLARILRAQRRFDEAIDVLRQSLDLNPGSQALHFDVAQCIRESAPNADTTQSDAILYHFRRAFTPGDKNNEARFWYARQLCLRGEYAEARPLFDQLKSVSMPLRQRRSLRGVVLDEDGNPAVYNGQVLSRFPTYGFVRSDKDGLVAFFAGGQLKEGQELPEVGARVSYNLGFNLSGPVATALALI